jgi:hypothetical protein
VPDPIPTTPHRTAAKIAVMIANPTEANRQAAIQALIEAPDDEYQAAIDAFVFTYPKAEPMRILIAGLRESNKRKAATP